MFERTWTKELYFKKLVLYLAQFCHSAVLKYSHKTQFPLANFARICQNLLVSGLLGINEHA